MNSASHIFLVQNFHGSLSAGVDSDKGAGLGTNPSGLFTGLSLFVNIPRWLSSPEQSALDLAVTQRQHSENHGPTDGAKPGLLASRAANNPRPVPENAVRLGRDKSGSSPDGVSNLPEKSRLCVALRAQPSWRVSRKARNAVVNSGPIPAILFKCGRKTGQIQPSTSGSCRVRPNETGHSPGDNAARTGATIAARSSRARTANFL